MSPRMSFSGVPTHGADKHKNVTRKLLISTGNYYTGTANGGDEEYDNIGLSATTNQLIYFTFRVPSDFVSFTSLEVVWFGRAGGTLGFDWVCNPTASYCAVNELVTNYSQTPGAITIDVASARKVYVNAVGLTLVGLATEDYVGVIILRAATNAADTWQQQIGVLGLLFTYVAEQ